MKPLVTSYSGNWMPWGRYTLHELALSQPIPLESFDPIGVGRIVNCPYCQIEVSQLMLKEHIASLRRAYRSSLAVCRGGAQSESERERERERAFFGDRLGEFRAENPCDSVQVGPYTRSKDYPKTLLPRSGLRGSFTPRSFTPDSLFQ